MPKTTQRQSYKFMSLSQRRNQVLKMIRKYRSRGAACFEVAEALGWPMHSVSGRMTELKQMGMLRPTTRVLNPASGVFSQRWSGV